MASLAELAILLTARDTASATIGKVKASAGGLEKSFGTLGAAGQRAGTESASGLGKIGPAASAQRNPISSLTSALGGIGLASIGIQAVAGALGGLGKVAGFGLATEMENTRTQFLAFTKDAALTDQILADLRSEADKTPFSFQELSKATASLIPASKQANVPLKDLIKTAEILAASNPAQGLEGAAFSLREALSGDFVSIIDRFNLPRQRLNELKAQGVPALQAITTAMSEMGIDASLVAGMATTMSGRLSTLGDTVDSLKLAFVTPIFEAFKEGLVGLQSGLDLNMDGMKAFAATAGKAVGQFASSIVKGIPVAISALSKLGPVISSVGPAIASIAGMVRASLPTLQSLGKQFVALAKFIHLVVIDGDTMNDWLTHMSPAFRSVAYIVGTTIVQLRALGRILLEVIRSPVVGWIRDMAGSLLSLLFSVREGSGEFRAMIAPLNLVALGLTALITAMVVGTVLSFVSAVGGLAASILTFPLRPLITASEAVAGFVKNTAGLVSKAISVTANVVTSGAEALANLLTNKSIDVNPKLGDTSDFDEFFSRERIIPTKVDPKVSGPIDEGAAKGFGSKIGSLIGTAIGPAIGAAVGGTLGAALVGLGGAALAALLLPGVLVAATIVAAGFAGFLAFKFQEEIGIALRFLGGAIVDGFVGLNSAFDRLDAFVGERISGAFSGAVGAASEAFGGLKGTVISALADVLGAVIRFGFDLAGDPIGSILGALETASIAFRDFPLLVGKALLDGIGGLNEAFDRFDAFIGERIKGIFGGLNEDFAAGLRRGAEIWEEFKARIFGRGTPAPFLTVGVGGEGEIGSPRLVTREAFEAMQGEASGFVLPAPDISGFTTAFENAKTSVMSTLEGLRASVVEGLAAMVSGGEQTLDNLVAFVAGAFTKGIGGGINASLKHFTDFVTGVGRRANDARELLESWLDSARRIFATFQPLSWIAGALAALISGITGALVQVVSAIVTAVQSAFTAFSGFRPWDAVSGGFSTLISNAQARLDDFLGAIRGAVSTASDLWDDLTKPRAAAVPVVQTPVFVPTPAPPAFEYPPDTSQEDAYSYQTGPGQYKVVPGAPNQPKFIMAHGGEVIGRPLKSMADTVMSGFGKIKSYATAPGEFKVVEGPIGDPVPIMAHGGEFIGEGVDPGPFINAVLGGHFQSLMYKNLTAGIVALKRADFRTFADEIFGYIFTPQAMKYLVDTNLVLDPEIAKQGYGAWYSPDANEIRVSSPTSDLLWAEGYHAVFDKARKAGEIPSEFDQVRDILSSLKDPMVAATMAPHITAYQSPTTAIEDVDHTLAYMLQHLGNWDYTQLPKVVQRSFEGLFRPDAFLPPNRAWQEFEYAHMAPDFQPYMHNLISDIDKEVQPFQAPAGTAPMAWLQTNVAQVVTDTLNKIRGGWDSIASEIKDLVSPHVVSLMADKVEVQATPTGGASPRVREVFQNALGEFWTRLVGSTENPPFGFHFAYPESYQTMPGQMKMVPGGINEPRLIMAHGGEAVMRPINSSSGLSSTSSASSASVKVDIHMGPVNVTNEADEQRLADTIVQGLEESLTRQFGMSTSFPHGLRGKA